MNLNPAAILKALGTFGQDKIAMALCQWSGVSPHEFQQLLIMNYQFISKLDQRLIAIERKLDRLWEFENDRSAERHQSNGQLHDEWSGSAGGCTDAGTGEAGGTAL